MVFFQAALLLGYAYAHFGSKWLGARTHAIVHLVLLAVSFLVFLPFAVKTGFNPSKSGLDPSLTLLSFLALTVGLPHTLLSAGAPLVQRWFSQQNLGSPYHLYAASNFGSLLALISYPFLIDGNLSVNQQSEYWKWGFGGLILCLAAVSVPLLSAKSMVQEVEDSPAPTTNQKLRWVFLSAVPASLLMGVTSHLQTNLASIPLLWVIPLSLYLLTFIFAFARKRMLGSEKLGRYAAMMVAPLTLVMILEASEPFLILAGFHLLVFFLCAWMAHTELAETTPGEKHVTEFYLWMSLGGVLGGAFTALVAPQIFHQIFEYPIALVALLALRWKPGAPAMVKRDWIWLSLVLAVSASAMAISQVLKMPPSNVRTGLTIGLPAILCFFLLERPMRYAFSIAGLFILAWAFRLSAPGNILSTDRSFFGVHRVTQNLPFRNLIHGTTIHGRQNIEPGKSNEPLTYYHRTGPIGVTIEALQQENAAQEVGLVGLGVGSLAAYAKPGDRYTFFEIDPTVIRLAQDPKLFTYLRDCEGSLAFVEGDARLSLQSQDDQKFDLLAIDAFSSDAIPVHLLTVEALEMYIQKVKPEGVVAVHISNRFLELAPIVAGACEMKGWSGIYFSDTELFDVQRDEGKTASQWFLVARSDAAFRSLNRDVRWQKLSQISKKEPWTDQRSNVLEAWRKRKETF